MTQELLFRDMEISDLKAVSRGDALVEETPWTQEGFADVLREGWDSVVGEIDGEIVSWGVIRDIVGESELLTIGVMPNYQRRGIGEATLRVLLDKMKEKGVSHCFLEVRESNLRARRLYQKLGFKSCGRDYYRLGDGHEDAIVMQLTWKSDQ
mgnify:FL=1